MSPIPLSSQLLLRHHVDTMHDNLNAGGKSKHGVVGEAGPERVMGAVGTIFGGNYIV